MTKRLILILLLCSVCQAADINIALTSVDHCSMYSSSTYGAFVVSNAFDDNPSTQHVTNALPVYIEWGFSGPRAITTFAGTTSVANNGPTDFTITGSTTGAFGGEEVTLLTTTGASWSAGVRQEFALSSTGNYQYYRLNMTATTAGNPRFNALEFLLPDDDPSLDLPYASGAYGSDLTSGETASASSIYIDNPTYGADKAIDDNAGTAWLSAAADETRWFQVQFAAAHKLHKMNWTPRSNEGEHSPGEFTLLGSDTGAFGGEETTILHGYSRGWTVLDEKRVFTWTNENAYTYYRVSYLPAPYGDQGSCSEMELFSGDDSAPPASGGGQLIIVEME